MSGVSGILEERRIFERLETNFPANFLDIAWGREVKAKITDISAQGLGAVIQEKLEESVPLKIWLHFPDKKRPFATQGRVAWVKPEPNDAWRIGVRFDDVEFVGLSRLFRMARF